MLERDGEGGDRDKEDGHCGRGRAGDVEARGDDREVAVREDEAAVSGSGAAEVRVVGGEDAK